MNTDTLIALGANLGDRAATLDAAIEALAEAPEVELIRRSAWQMTLPVGGTPSQPEFLNGAARVRTSHSAADFHALLNQIESQFGRERHERWGNRTLDLDLLLYGDAVIDTPGLTVPHPRMSFRRFVLEPAVEIAGEMVHPIIGLTLEQLVERLETGADCVAIVSSDAATGEKLAATLRQRIGLAETEPPIDDEGLWPAAETVWLAASGCQVSHGRPKLTILLADAAASIAGRGPTLHVDVSCQDLWRETAAAIEAVWPHLGSLPGGRLQ